MNFARQKTTGSEANLSRASGPDRRPPTVIAAEWVSKIQTISLEMALPAGLGYWLDGQWNTSPWLVTLGAVLGFAVSIWHLLQLTEERSNRTKK